MAVKFLNDLFIRASGLITTIGIGDSPNDESMLDSVELPIIVKRPSGFHDPQLTAQRRQRPRRQGRPDARYRFGRSINER